MFVLKPQEDCDTTKTLVKDIGNAWRFDKLNMIDCNKENKRKFRQFLVEIGNLVIMDGQSYCIQETFAYTRTDEFANIVHKCKP